MSGCQHGYHPEEICARCLLDERSELRADRDNATRVVTELTTEVEKLRAEEASLKILWRNANAACHELAAERDSLKAQLAEAQQVIEGLNIRYDACAKSLWAARAETESAEAQLAEEKVVSEKRLWLEVQARALQESAEEQLRVAREALDRRIAALRYGIGDIIGAAQDRGHQRYIQIGTRLLAEDDAFTEPASSASAPKAEPHTHPDAKTESSPFVDGQPTHDASECECCEATAKARADLMRVAEKVRDAIKPELAWDGYRWSMTGRMQPVDLAAIVKSEAP